MLINRPTPPARKLVTWAFFFQILMLTVVRADTATSGFSNEKAFCLQRRWKSSLPNKQGCCRNSAPGKGAGLQRVKRPPGNWFAPPGSNRNGGGGNEAVEAFDGKGR